jgi:hypothetical protein
MGFSDIVDGAKNFANNVAGGLNEAFLGSENTNRALSDAANTLAKSIEKAAQRTYIMDGFANNEKTKPNNRNVISQSPELIILIKKKMFSTLSDNFRAEFMDKDEKLFIRAAKKLFENKCAEISAYESLTKLNKVVRQNGVINSAITKMIYNTINTIENQFNSSGVWIPGSASTDLGESDMPGFLEVNKYVKFITENKSGVKTLKNVLELNGFSNTTNWVKNSNFEKPGSLGVGTGVIELTLVSQFTCTNSINFGSGSGNMTIEDPNRLLFVDESDIEKAIYQASDTKFSILDVLTQELEGITEEYKQELNNSRLKRGASVVIFHLNLKTRIYNRLTVILDRIGLELTSADGSGIDYSRLDAPNVPEIEQFTAQERKLLNLVYDNTFKILKGRIQNFENFKAYNIENNYTRRLMRQFFCGKQIIQPMDTVTAFVDSQRVDDEMLSFFVNDSFNPVSKGIISSGLSELFDRDINLNQQVSSFSGSSNFGQLMDKAVGAYTYMDAEKNAIAGEDFPLWLYRELKSSFDPSSFGTCIFSGIVETVSESYQNGSYTVNVGLKDNSYFFDQSLINNKPGLDQFNGFLYDPITPFDFEFDAATGLLPAVSQYKLLEENEGLVNSGFFRFPDGKYSGQLITPENFINTDMDPIDALTKITGSYSQVARKVFDAPDGMVYRWKRGIGSATINQSGTDGGLLSTNLITEKLALVQQTDPFAGQDVVNVMSILITGEPYNFNTYMKAAMEAGTVNIDNAFLPDTDYFAGLQKVIRKQNRIWGDFIPFKKLSTDPDKFSQALALQNMSFSLSNTIRKKQDERSKLLNKLMQFESDSFQFDINSYDINANNPGNSIIFTSNRAVSFPIIKKIVELGTEIQILEESIKRSLRSNQISKSLIAMGNNIFYDDLSTLTKDELKEKLETFGAEQNYLTMRPLWKVKANGDPNYFIVDSAYDTDYDIQGLALQLATGFDLVNMAWTTIKNQLINAVKVIGMELFANSQGHIELRIPRYNKVPSSILFDMIRKKREYGIQVYPDFIESAFKNRVESAFTQIEIIEDQIRLYTIALGATDDDNDIASFLNGALQYTSESKFLFTTDENGELSSIRAAVISITSADYSQDPKNTPVPGFSLEVSVEEFFKRNSSKSYIAKFTSATNTYNNFDIIKQNQNLKEIYNRYNNSFASISLQQAQAEKIRSRLATKMGVSVDSQAIKTIPQLLPNSKNSKISPIDANNLQSKINGLVSMRHQLLITAVNLIKSLDEAARFNSDNTEILSKLLMPNLYGSKNIPTFLKDMVENESEDDYGIGSAKRFIIKESEIIAMEYSENQPTFTHVEVSGSEVGGLLGPGFNIGGSADFKIANVWSTDFDMWRMYGFKVGETANLPFLNDPELQLAPYASFLLNKQRKNILRAKCTLVGNEAIQPGEVYYIEDRGMLFYSESVTQSFTYGVGFTTDISLAYGHLPGEYIPTSLDVLGRNLYKGNNTNVGGAVISRSGTTSTDKGTALGVINFPNYATSGYPSSKTGLSPLEQLNDGDIGGKNSKTLKNIIAKATILADANIPQENRGYQAITVRVYGTSDSREPALWEAAQEIIKYLQNKGIPPSKIVGRFPESDTLVPGEPFYINIMQKGYRNPSAEAINLAKETKDPAVYPNVAIPELKSNDLQGLSSQAKFALLYKTIDVWLESDINPNESIINSAVQSPTVDNTQDASTGVNPNNTTPSLVLENMRSFYNKVVSDFNSAVTVEAIE